MGYRWNVSDVVCRCEEKGERLVFVEDLRFVRDL
jgi:hypothetical protein